MRLIIERDGETLAERPILADIIVQVDASGNPLRVLMDVTPVPGSVAIGTMARAAKPGSVAIGAGAWVGGKP